MSFYNLFGVGLSTFGMTYGGISAYSGDIISSYFGFGIWIIGCVLMLFAENKEGKK